MEAVASKPSASNGSSSSNSNSILFPNFEETLNATPVGSSPLLESTPIASSSPAMSSASPFSLGFNEALMSTLERDNNSNAFDSNSSALADRRSSSSGSRRLIPLDPLGLGGLPSDANGSQSSASPVVITTTTTAPSLVNNVPSVKPPPSPPPSYTESPISSQPQAQMSFPQQSQSPSPAPASLALFDLRKPQQQPQSPSPQNSNTSPQSSSLAPSYPSFPSTPGSPSQPAPAVISLMVESKPQPLPSPSSNPFSLQPFFPSQTPSTPSASPSPMTPQYQSMTSSISQPLPQAPPAFAQMPLSPAPVTGPVLVAQSPSTPARPVNGGALSNEALCEMILQERQLSADTYAAMLEVMKTLREAVTRVSSLEKEVSHLKDKVTKVEQRKRRKSKDGDIHKAASVEPMSVPAYSPPPLSNSVSAFQAPQPNQIGVVNVAPAPGLYSLQQPSTPQRPPVTQDSQSQPQPQGSPFVQQTNPQQPTYILAGNMPQGQQAMPMQYIVTNTQTPGKPGGPPQPMYAQQPMVMMQNPQFGGMMPQYMMTAPQQQVVPQGALYSLRPKSNQSDVAPPGYPGAKH